MFQVNKQNLEHARAVVEAYGECWLHGCGNIYATKEDHEFRKKYSNPLHNGQASAPKYFAHFTSVHQIPDTVEQLHKIFEANHTNQIREAALKESAKGAPSVKVLKVPKKEVAADSNAGTVSGPDTETLIKAAAQLHEKNEELNGLADMLDKREIELEEQHQDLQLKARQFDDREAEFKKAAQKQDQDLQARLKAIQEKETALAAKEAELSKKAGKDKPNQ